MSPRRRARRGFTLVEVMAAFVVALLLLAPIAAMIGGVAGSFSALERSSQRQTLVQQAAAAAMAAEPLQQGEFTAGDFLVTAVPSPQAAPSGLERTRWQLYTVTVHSAADPSAVLLETLRIGRR